MQREEIDKVKILDTAFVSGFIRLCDDGFNMGWHERNGGNLSYRIKDSEVAMIADELNYSADWNDIGTCVPELSGEYFLVTGSGKFFRNVRSFPEENICIIRLNESGDKYQKVWGLKDGGRPTSELPSHLMNLEVCKKRDAEIRVVYHCHPANMIALTYTLPLDSEVFTRELWEMATECPIVFPEGVGVVPWMVPGGREIAVATSEIMKTQDFAVWAHHGCFACGTDFDITFGLMHTVEKAAEILVKVMSMTDRKRQTISEDEFRLLNEPFGVNINERFLYKRKSLIIGERIKE